MIEARTNGSEGTDDEVGDVAGGIVVTDGGLISFDKCWLKPRGSAVDDGGKVKLNVGNMSLLYRIKT